MATTLEGLEVEAKRGNADAQCSLGRAFVNGHGVCKNLQKAAEWYRRAAKQGHIGAQFTLGWMYERGQGVRLDWHESEAWYRKAAEQGHPGAQLNLGTLYVKGKVGARDPDHAVFWFMKAAESGHPKAQANLGLHYLSGCGITRGQAVRIYLAFDCPQEWLQELEASGAPLLGKDLVDEEGSNRMFRPHRGLE